MIILGVDPGLANTGWGVISYDGKTLRPVSYGVIQTESKEGEVRRIFTIAEDIGTIAEKYGVDTASIEDIYFNQNITTAIPVAKVIGAIVHKLTSMSIDCHIYNPREIKLGVVGIGNADKNQVQDMVKRILRLKEIPRPDHAADALADCICHVTHNSTKFQ